MANYTYRLENGEYVFYKDNKVLKTPNDVVVKTTKEELAKYLLTNLEQKMGYTAPFSFLTYHYTYCNLEAQYDLNFIADDFTNCVDYEALMNDDYLMFRQPSPVKQAIAQFFAKELPENFHNYNLYQLTAILVIHSAFNSWMLSQYIIADIIEPLYEDEEADIDALEEEFLDDLEDFECEEFDCDPEDEAYIRHLEDIKNTITAFRYYFTLQDQD
jgi:hypothetical protein